jgi:hypothetical protein
MRPSKARPAACIIAETTVAESVALIAFEFRPIGRAAVVAEMPIAAIHIIAAPASAIHAPMMMVKAAVEIAGTRTLAAAIAAAEISRRHAVMMVGNNAAQNQDEDEPVQREADDGESPEPGQLPVEGGRVGRRRCFVHDGGS